MAHETVTKSKRFYCVSLTPDICKTPVGNSVVPIPYTITGEFKDAKDVSRSVKTQSAPVFLHNKSVIPSVKGDERGTLGGIKSGTYLKTVESKDYSSTKGSNGTQTIQESRFVWMNNRNTLGRIYERGVQAARTRLQSVGKAASETLHDAAQGYKDNVSDSLHQFGKDAMDKGGDIAMGSAAVGVGGLAVGATGVGLPVAAAMETTAAAGGVTAGAVTATGYAADTSATVLDQAADYILTGKTPDIVTAATGMATSAAENLVFKKVAKLGSFLKKLMPSKKAKPGSTPPAQPKPQPKATDGDGKDGKDGGKTKQTKEPKSDKPSDCCPKDGAPGGKPVKSNHPVHFGTGEEILPQTDFVLEGPTPLAWTRTYRSGSETEDWGLLGARWGTPYTSSISFCAKGTVYHDATGRAVRIPSLAIGQQHDHRGEGFILKRDSDQQVTLTWRDGSIDTFTAGPEGWLPHGYDGVNAMLTPRTPVRTQRYYLTRRAERDGSGITIERNHAAQPGEVLLRVRTDDGLTIEALRDAHLPVEFGPGPQPAAPRIGRIEQVLPDGTRLCHVRYRYEAALPDLVAATAPAGSFEALPLRCNLVEQSNIADQSRSYTYKHHLLQQYTTYSGFAHGLEWVSLAFLRERWAGNALDDAQLSERCPITIDNSYQARAVRTTTADGRDEVQLTYIDADTTRVTEPDGGVLEYQFNSQWLATGVHRIGPDGGRRSLGRREWDHDGMLLADIDADGNDNRYNYDSTGNLISLTDAQQNVTRIEYDSHNQPIAITDALGHTTRTAYNNAGRITERTDALGRRTAYAYDAQGRLAVVTDARGGNKRLSYDAAGRLASYTDCSNFTTRYSYDSHGRLTEYINAIGSTTRYQYDPVGHMTSIVYPDGTTERFDFDADGNLVTHIDAKKQRTRYHFDGHGALVEKIDAKEQSLRYKHDQALRLVELINGNGDSYKFSYDAESRLVSETGFDGKVTTFTYSAAGNLMASNSAGIATDFARDALGRLLAKSSPDGAVRYAYDALGRLTAAATAQAEHRFGYDAAGQLIEERMAYAPGPVRLPGEPKEYVAAFTMTHAYDELGNRIQTVLPNGRRVDTLRYGSGHWHGTLWQGKSLVDLERDHLHRETLRELGGDKERLTERRSYDPQSRLNSFTLDKGAQRLRERRYEYDAASNLVYIDDKFGGSIRYAYDPLGQLLSAVQPDLTETFAFDPAGNLLDTGAAAEPISTRQILRDLDEQPAPDTTAPPLAKVTHNLLRQYMGYSYEYDVQGNTIAKFPRMTTRANDEGILEFKYNSENRLTTAIRTFTNSRQVARYSYDAFGRRIAKRVEEQQWQAGQSTPSVELDHAGKLTLFMWDGDVLTQEIHADKTVTYLYEPDSFVPLTRIESNEGSCRYAMADTHILHVDAWAPPSPPFDDDAHVRSWMSHRETQFAQLYHEQSVRQLAQADVDAVRDRILYFQCDHLGTPMELRDEYGAVAWAMRFHAWGRMLQRSKHTVEQPLRFQGQYEDNETGLYYNRNRFYDPDIGRYITQDPIRLEGGLNPYQYAPNSIGWIDPLGLAKLMQLGTYGSLNGGANVNDNLQAHELVRHEYLVQKGLANKNCRDADNPSIALDLDHHTRGPQKDTRGIGGAHYHEGRIRVQQGLGRNEFHPSIKRELDITQGGLRKAGVPASRARKLRKQSEQFLRNQNKCRACPTDCPQ
ncbi:RHS repeat-associated core domain-containing protein [Duganella sp. CF458]|uniref:RHS repeat-associated core domain-containing protein n=1 Tax=Duganella sp. CF458 TaxID=1884368 RepID=UPI0008E77F36|nr:RHS repeat-associated core domain-containing protein [Duganella sp. CF458]SFG42779.1 RHS repeat-associated core domain-containing protein [Duganella sp. CF458]